MPRRNDNCDADNVTDDNAIDDNVTDDNVTDDNVTDDNVTDDNVTAQCADVNFTAPVITVQTRLTTPTKVTSSSPREGTSLGQDASLCMTPRDTGSHAHAQ